MAFQLLRGIFSTSIDNPRKPAELAMTQKGTDVACLATTQRDEAEQ
jgi:hypothetical protein